MTILITGGAGYIGSHTVEELKSRGYDILVYDNLSEGFQKALPKDVDMMKADLKDRDQLKQVFEKYKIKTVIHFAGFISVAESVENPEKYFENNVNNTLILLDVMKEFNVDKIVFSSSAAVYGDAEGIPITEDSPTKPKNPYGETKLEVESILKKYDKEYGIKSVSLRYFNASGASLKGNIGEAHDPETHLIPLVLKAALEDKEIKIFGTDYDTEDGTCVRDYIHVTDLADAHILALEYLLKGGKTEVFNLGNGKGFSVRQIIDFVKEITGKGIKTIEQGRRAGDPPILIASNEKIKKALGWGPKYSDIKTIISSAWKWHKEHPNGYGE